MLSPAARQPSLLEEKTHRKSPQRPLSFAGIALTWVARPPNLGTCPQIPTRPLANSYEIGCWLERTEHRRKRRDTPTKSVGVNAKRERPGSTQTKRREILLANGARRGSGPHCASRRALRPKEQERFLASLGMTGEEGRGSEPGGRSLGLLRSVP